MPPAPPPEQCEAVPGSMMSSTTRSAGRWPGRAPGRGRRAASDPEARVGEPASSTAAGSPSNTTKPSGATQQAYCQGQFIERPRAEMARQRRYQRHDPAAHQGFTPGQAQLAYALGDEGGTQPIEFFKGKNVAFGGMHACPLPYSRRRSPAAVGDRAPEGRRWRGQTIKSEGRGRTHAPCSNAPPSDFLLYLSFKTLRTVLLNRLMLPRAGDDPENINHFLAFMARGWQGWLAFSIASVPGHTGAAPSSRSGAPVGRAGLHPVYRVAYGTSARCTVPLASQEVLERRPRRTETIGVATEIQAAQVTRRASRGILHREAAPSSGSKFLRVHSPSAEEKVTPTFRAKRVPGKRKVTTGSPAGRNYAGGGVDDLALHRHLQLGINFLPQAWACPGSHVLDDSPGRTCREGT